MDRRPKALRGKGINYDTGFWPSGEISRVSFEPEVVRREMQIIADDLHCNAVRITGGDPARLSIAGEHAAAAGLEIWFSPFPCELTAAQMLPYFTECAERAEDLRNHGGNVVFCTGCELSLFAAGFLPGDGFMARIGALHSAESLAQAAMKELPGRLNSFLAESTMAIRQRFGGRVTYAATSFENVDWNIFDIVGIDAYRSARNAGTYQEQLRQYSSYGKPVAATEFGCCTYRGAASRAAGGWLIFDERGEISIDYIRDENEQASYLRELLEIFRRESIDSVFLFTFAAYGLPHRSDPRRDSDMASFGVVKMLEDRYGDTYPDMVWEPKEAFHALAASYADDS